MVDGIVQVHLDKYQAVGADLIFGDGTFCEGDAPEIRTLIRRLAEENRTGELLSYMASC